jgi:hypothetical protein
MLAIGVAGLGCDLQDDKTEAPRDNAAGRSDNDGAPSVSGSESTGKNDGGNRTIPGGNTIPTK